MRSRFLNIDFFHRVSEETLENTYIFRLPVPQLPPPSDLPTQGEEIAIAIAIASYVSGFSFEIGPFPFEKALSQFLSFVLPPIYDDSHILCSGNGIRKSRFREAKTDEKWRNFRSEEIEIGNPEEENGCFASERSEGKGRKLRSETQDHESVEVKLVLCKFRSETPIYDVSHVLCHGNGKSRFHEAKIYEKWRNFRSEEIEIETPEEENGCSVSERSEGKGRKFRSETQEHESVEENDYFGEKNVGMFRGLQFEMPELVFPLAEIPYSDKEGEKAIRFEIPDFQIPVDIHEVKLRDTISYPQEVSRSIYSVEDITVECSTDPNSQNEEDADRTLPYYSKLLNFEVSEVDLDIYTCPSMEDELHSLLSNIGHIQWVEKNGFHVDCKELLGSVNVDILECLSEHGPSKQFPKPQPTCLISLLDMDYVSMTDNLHLDRHLVIDPKTSRGYSFSLVNTLQFHEVEILDLAYFQSFQAFATSLLTYVPETWEQMLKEDMKAVGSFYESIINTELALVDDTFKSLPVPFLCEDKEIIPLSSVVEDILDELKVQRASACDGIYLDWHLLQEETCNRGICSTYRNLLEGIDTHEIATELQSSNVGVVIDFVFLDDTQDELNNLQCKEMLDEIPSISVNNDLTKCNTNQLLKDEDKMSISGEPTVINPERISLLLESMSQFSDLNFFLKARKGITGGKSEDASKEKTDSKATVSVISSRDSIMTCPSHELTFRQWEIEVHHIKLSDHILGLIDNIHKNYSSILQNDTDLKRQHCSSQVVDDFKLLSLSKQMLMDLITSTSAQHPTTSGEDKARMAYIALYASKQMAHYLCFFGIHSSHLYTGKLSQTLKYLRIKLNSLLSLIEDAYWKAENGTFESHPSLSTIEEILRSNFPQNGKKVLIVADRVFWWILNRKLTSMGILFHEVKNTRAHSIHLGALDSDDFKNSILNALLQSDCLVISYEHIFPLFPFNKFSIVLEYGGSYDSSRIVTISPELVGLPHIHFLKMELEEFSVPKALCEGFDASQYHDSTMESVSPSMSGLQEGLSNQQIVGLLNFLPTGGKDGCMASFEATDTASHMPNTASGVNVFTKTKEKLLCMPSFPDIVIIVNTQNVDKEMLISRRSSYQKILAMEKGGVQVIERELNLPVDLIFSADICLVWYDARSFVINGTSAEKAFSCIPEYMENIATNILMSLSFSFSGCIMVFEGESSFLTAIMESSDGLYAAAASLDIQLQLFCSYSSDSTDGIILNSIRSATKLNQGLYPAMLESETLAESFLTRFPSINPISAHAILSSGGMLVEFLEWSHDQRIQAIGKYHVPDESMDLFNSLCRYGELGESKSGMTDCSSALSSALDSDYCSSKLQSQRKRQKYTMNTQSLDSPTEECCEPLNRFEDCNPKPSKSSRPHQSRNLSTDCEILDKPDRHNYTQKDHVLYEKRGVDASLMNDIDWDEINIYENAREDFRSKAPENSSIFLDEDVSMTDTRCWAAPQTEKVATARNSVPTIRSSFGTSSLPVFPTSAEIDNDLDTWLSLKGHSQKLEDGICGNPDNESSMKVLPMKNQEDFFKESKMQKSTRNALGLSFPERVTLPYGETPLSTPIHTSGLQQGSPWMIEFLNRVKEKASSRHQQSTPCNTRTNQSGSYGNIEKFVKRQSPSSLDSYRYQGGSKTKKAIQLNRPKQFRKPPISVKSGKKAFSFSPTWTPVDKRARQNLSFTRSGNEKQSKLIWNEGTGQSLRKRYREEA